MEDDTLANAITYILLLRVKSFPKMYVTLCPPKWYHSPPLAHALLELLSFNQWFVRVFVKTMDVAVACMQAVLWSG